MAKRYYILAEVPKKSEIGGMLSVLEVAPNLPTIKARKTAVVNARADESTAEKKKIKRWLGYGNMTREQIANELQIYLRIE